MTVDHRKARLGNQNAPNQINIAEVNLEEFSWQPTLNTYVLSYPITKTPMNNGGVNELLQYFLSKVN